jgi:DNA-binding NarL/FixJ family response regulator
MAGSYVVAASVLPKPVLEAVSKALRGKGAFLWIPSKRNLHRDQRDDHVQALHAEGWTVPRIAELLFLSERTVWRILAKKRASAAPSAKRGRPPRSNPQLAK